MADYWTKAVRRGAGREEELHTDCDVSCSIADYRSVHLVIVIFSILTGRKADHEFQPDESAPCISLMIACTGVFFIMTMGGLDFSQGSILGIASIVICAVSKVSIPLSIVCGILSGAAIGAINGFFYVNRKIKSFIVTICTMFLFRGFIKYLTTNSPVAGNASLIYLDTTGLKVTLTVIVLLVGFICFRFTRFGTDLKAIGAGEKAAKFAGIRTDRMKVLDLCTVRCHYRICSILKCYPYRIRYLFRRQSAGDPDPDRPGSWRHADFRRRKGKLPEHHRRFSPLCHLKFRTEHDGRYPADEPDDSGYYLPDLRIHLRRS
jgi:hypothetical protein